VRFSRRQRERSIAVRSYRIVDAAQGDVVVRLKPFDAIEFPLGVLWQC